MTSQMKLWPLGNVTCDKSNEIWPLGKVTCDKSNEIWPLGKVTGDKSNETLDPWVGWVAAAPPQEL